ncbi:CG7810 [Drosophila busckii]|uniref:CG7810 n=1 Tax=Drosophila busckii TaxID=30019 RepID=A0A0M4EF13_DROBS|nr:coiled-coil domain-containing protein 97 [Drosophila busckii]ALC38905.1 CG7810 [Drosophila busckii]
MTLTAAEDSAAAAELPNQLVDIFKALANNSSIVFKSQQIDDPELQLAEKQQIAHNAFSKNRENFLIRFGSFLDEQQLSDFQTLGMQPPIKPDENLEEMCLLLLDYQRKLHTRKVCVKNRRYRAMQQLLQKGEYFSEHEMMQRAPELYQELVGQYLSAQEIKQRDSYDVRNTTFSGILMHSLEQQQRNELLQQLESSENIREEPAEYAVPPSCKTQWGGFDDDEPVACSTSRNTAKLPTLSTPQFYTAGERELMRNEFMGIMKERFLTGQDEDFDYAAVDNNAQLDDLQQIEQDAQDAYFDEDEASNIPAASAPRDVSDEESEDELERYMRHLNNHHSLRS